MFIVNITIIIFVAVGIYCEYNLFVYLCAKLLRKHIKSCIAYRTNARRSTTQHKNNTADKQTASTDAPKIGKLRFCLLNPRLVELLYILFWLQEAVVEYSFLIDSLINIFSFVVVFVRAHTFNIMPIFSCVCLHLAGWILIHPAFSKGIIYLVLILNKLLCWLNEKDILRR